MLVLATWPPMAIIAEPSEEHIKAAIHALDNETHLGLSLFQADEQSEREERIVVMGGERVNVAYRPASAEEPAFYLRDNSADTLAQVLINYGDQGELAYPAQETVEQEIALEEILYFMRHRRISAYGAWVPYETT